MLTVVATGVTGETAARQLNISERTLRRRVDEACGRIGVDNRVQAIVWAVRQGLV